MNSNCQDVSFHFMIVSILAYFFFLYATKRKRWICQKIWKCWHFNKRCALELFAKVKCQTFECFKKDVVNVVATEKQIWINRIFAHYLLYTYSIFKIEKTEILFKYLSFGIIWSNSSLFFLYMWAQKALNFSKTLKKQKLYLH